MLWALVFLFASPVFLAFRRCSFLSGLEGAQWCSLCPVCPRPNSSSHYKILWKRHLFSHFRGAMGFFCPHGFADCLVCPSLYLPSFFFEAGLELAGSPKVTLNFCSLMRHSGETQYTSTHPQLGHPRQTKILMKVKCDF